MLGLAWKGVVKVVTISLSFLLLLKTDIICYLLNKHTCNCHHLSVCPNAKGAKVILRVKKGEGLAARPIVRHAHGIRLFAFDRRLWYLLLSGISTVLSQQSFLTRSSASSTQLVGSSHRHQVIPSQHSQYMYPNYGVS